MAMSKLPILKPVTTGYADAWAAIRMMPVLAGVTFLVMLAVGLAEYLVPSDVSEDPVFANLVGFVVSAAQSFLLTPIMMAVHRFIILGEVTPSYRLEPGSHVFQAFFGWLLALSFVGFVAVTFVGINVMPSTLSLGVVLIFLVVVLVIMARLAILLPAIAVEAPGSTAANAWADSKRHTFGIFLIFLVAVLPIFIGTLFVMFPFVLSSDPESGALSVPATVIMAVVQMFAVMLFVAIASRLYQALADRLLRGPATKLAP